MQVSIDLKTEPIRQVTAATIAALAPGTFATIDITRPVLEHPARLVMIQNLTDADLFISDSPYPTGPFDIKFALMARQSIIIDCTTNRTDVGGSLCYAQGTKFSVTQLGTPTTGAIYLTSFYAGD